MTRTPRPSTKVQDALKMHTVPAEKWHRIVLRTTLGVGLIGVALLGGFKLAWNQWLVVAVVGVGAHMVSGQMFMGSVRAVIGLVGAAAKAVKGGDSGAPDA